MSLASRIDRIERRHGDAFQVVVIRGGLPGPISYASATKSEQAVASYDKRPNESFDTFQRRVTADAKANGVTLLVIGGLRDE